MSQYWGSALQAGAPTPMPLPGNPYDNYHPGYGRTAALRRTFDEGVKKRDELIKQLQKENDELNRSYKELDAEHEKCEERYDQLMEKYKALEARLADLQRSIDHSSLYEEKAINWDKKKLNIKRPRAPEIPNAKTKRPKSEHVTERMLDPAFLPSDPTPTVDWNAQVLAERNKPTLATEEDSSDESSSNIPLSSKE